MMREEEINDSVLKDIIVSIDPGIKRDGIAIVDAHIIFSDGNKRIAVDFGYRGQSHLTIIDMRTYGIWARERKMKELGI
jgi:ABC-type transporter MlaC component